MYESLYSSESHGAHIQRLKYLERVAELKKARLLRGVRHKAKRLGIPISKARLDRKSINQLRNLNAELGAVLTDLELKKSGTKEEQ